MTVIEECPYPERKDLIVRSHMYAYGTYLPRKEIQRNVATENVVIESFGTGHTYVAFGSPD